MAESDESSLAAFVRSRRLRRGLSQEALAERAGLTADTIGILERGLRRRLFPSTAAALATALDLDAADREAFAALAGGRSRSKGAPPPTVDEDAGSAPAEPLTTSAPAESPAHNLPALLTRLIGRERELAQIVDLLPRVRLVTLTGAGGAGKTRLALAVAQELLPQYAGGVWLVDLAPLTDPAHVLGAVAAALDVRESPGRPLLATLAATLKGRRMLLLLDNCEQVIAASPSIAALLMACPDLAVLATSRGPLQIAGEREILVAPLPYPDVARMESVTAVSQYTSVELFVERAQAARPDFALSEATAPAVAAICAQLDGLPLALELAAARVKLFPPAVIRDRLSQRLNLLTGGPRDRPARHRTLRATIAWSYDLLAPSEQALFRRLGVFAGGFTLDVVEALCTAGSDDGDDPIDVFDGLTALAGQSLIQRGARVAAAQPADETDSDPDDARFVMLETIREYALEQLAACGETERWHERLLDYAIDLMEQAEPDLHELASPEAVRVTRRRIALEQGNLRAALAWAIAQGRSEEALRLSGALCAWWTPGGNLHDSRPWQDQPAGLPREARRWLEQALALAPAPGAAPSAARAKALRGLGRVLHLQWEDPAAEQAAALEALRAALTIYRDLGDQAETGRTLHDLGLAYVRRLELEEAEQAFAEALAIAGAWGDGVTRGWSLLGLGRVAHLRGDAQRAVILCEDSFEQQQSAGNRIGMGAAADLLGVIHFAQRDIAEAERHFTVALDLRRQLGAQSGLAPVLQQLAVVMGLRGDAKAAAAMLGDSLVLGRESNNPWDMAIGLLCVGALAASARLLDQGVRLFGAGQALMAARDVETPAAFRAVYERSVAVAQRALGAEGYAAAFAAGAALPLDSAIDEALAIAGRLREGERAERPPDG